MSLLSPESAQGAFEDYLGQSNTLLRFIIGRSSESDIVLDDRTVSRRHAMLIQCSAELFLIEDLNSKNGTFVNNQRITRKVVHVSDAVIIGKASLDLRSWLCAHHNNGDLQSHEELKSDPLDFTVQFSALKDVYDQYPKLRKDCRNREKMIRTGSVIVSSIVGVGAVLASGGGALPALQLLSSAGLGMLIPTLCSSLLSTEEKIEVIDKEYRERYRCPNPECRDPFGTREWQLLAQQKTCRRCKAVWVK